MTIFFMSKQTVLPGKLFQFSVFENYIEIHTICIVVSEISINYETNVEVPLKPLGD